MMRKLIFVGILVLAMSGLALAQDFPKYEVFAGYSYLRSDLGNSTSWLGSYYNSDFSSGMLNGHGFEGSVTYNLSSWFGIKGDFSGQFGKVKMDGNTTYSNGVPTYYTETIKQVGSADVRQYTYLFGPEFTYRKHEKFRPFGHVLFGFTQIDGHKFALSYTELDQYTEGSSYFYTDSATGTFKGTSFAVAMGGGVDISVNKRVSLRLPQVDYVVPTLRSLKVNITEKYDSYTGTSTAGTHNGSSTYKDSIFVPTNLFSNVRVSAGLVFKF